MDSGAWRLYRIEHTDQDECAIRASSDAMRLWSALEVLATDDGPIGSRFVANPWLRTLHWRPPAHRDGRTLAATRGQDRSGQWIDMLRALGIVVLSDLDLPDAMARVPACFHPDRLLSPESAHRRSRGETPTSMAAEAPSPNSLLDIALRQGWLEGFLPQGAALPRAIAARASLPLFAVSPPMSPSGRAEVACWQHPCGRGRFDIGTARIHAVDGDGLLRVRDVPVDAAGWFWSRSASHRGWRVDPPWRREPCDTADGIGAGLPAVVGAVLREIVAEAVPPALQALARSRLPTWTDEVMREAMAALAPVRDSFRRRAYPFDGHARTSVRIAWLHAGGDPSLTLRRLQAETVAPRVLSTMEARPLPRTAEAIDSGLPLAAALAHDLAAPRWAVRRALPMATDGPDCDVGTLVAIVEALGERAAPVSRAELDGMLAAWRATSAAPTQVLSEEDRDLRRLLRAAAQPGIAGDDRGRAVAMAIPHWPHLQGYWHFLEASVEIACSADPPGGPSAAAIVDDMMDGLPLPRLLDASRRLNAMLHGRAPGDDADPMAPDDIAIAPLFPPRSTLDDGVSLEAVSSLARITRESDDMVNCVASYWPAMFHRRTLVVALAHARSGTRATASLVPVVGGAWRLTEAKACRNRELLEDSPFHAALAGLTQALTTRAAWLEPSLLAAYAAQATVDPRLAPQHGPPALQHWPERSLLALLRCFPGSGPFAQRVARTKRRLARRSAAATSPAVRADPI